MDTGTTLCTWRLGLTSALLALMIPTSAVTQNRSHGTALTGYKDAAVGDEGLLSVKWGSSMLRWSLLSGTGFQGGAIEQQMPFDIVGGITSLGGRFFLVSGLDSSGGGILVRVSLGDPLAPAVAVHETVSLGSLVDPLSVYWSAADSVLFVLDPKVNQVLQAPYSGGAAALPSSEFFLQAALLDEPVGNAFLLTAPRGGEVAGVAVFDPDMPNEYVHVFEGVDGWVAQGKVISPLTPAESAPWAVAEPSYVSVNGPVVVSGRVGAYELIEDWSGVVVANGASASVDSPQLISLPPEGLAAGYWYSVISRTDSDGGFARQAKFLPLVRYGVATGGSRARMSRGLTGTVCVGDSEFALSDVVRWADGFTDPIAVDVFLWISFRDAEGVDPVLTLGGNVCVLDPARLAAALGPVSVPVEGLQHGAFRFPLPIPADGGLAGNTILFQYAAIDPTDGAGMVSDVFGATIVTDGGAAGGLARSAGQRARFLDARQPPDKDMLLAVARWVRESGMDRRTDRGLVQQIHRSLRR